jgi:NADH dehydrogenase [ubiquinone] 1 alpha subcomplex assembly factor 7
MSDFPPLEAEIRRRIAAAGPMPVNEYMTLCLADSEHGYYTTRDPFGVGGDFTTAPEVTQMFGEMIGLWMAAVWKQMGSPKDLRVIELGPGRGTMMKDALRAAKVMPGFRNAVVIHLVEISPALVAYQQRTLEPLSMPIYWHPALADVPAGPAIVLANEFFDALPINQAAKTGRGWHERLIEIDSAGYLAFTIAPDPIPQFDRLLPPAVRDAPDDSIFEWRSDNVGFELGKRLARDGGAALVIDYGHTQSAAGETLQAVGKHAYAKPLSAPGSIDLTAHVDFQALGNAIEAMGTNGYGPTTQSQFLRRLGIVTRAASLKAKAADAVAAEIDAALTRLLSAGEAGMGALFKAAAFAHPSLGVPPGFET